MAEKEYAVVVTPPTAPTGRVRFTIRNTGAVEHEVVVLKTSLDEGLLPLDDTKQEAAENGSGVSHVTEREDIKPGGVATLTTKLSPGRYVLICNLPTHYGLGMHAAFTVQ